MATQMQLVCIGGQHSKEKRGERRVEGCLHYSLDMLSKSEIKFARLSEGRASRAERATANRLIFQSGNRGDCAQMEMQALPGP